VPHSSAIITGATGGIPADIAEPGLALAQLSARSVVPLIAMSRAGETHWQA
jgi:short-subunit dehydrogenase